nr:hypothetical protein [Cellulosimicrobium sp. MM]
MTSARKTATNTSCTCAVAKKTSATAATIMSRRHDQPAVVRSQAGTVSSYPTTDGLRRAPATLRAALDAPARCLTDAAERSEPEPGRGVGAGPAAGRCSSVTRASVASWPPSAQSAPGRPRTPGAAHGLGRGHVEVAVEVAALVRAVRAM